MAIKDSPKSAQCEGKHPYESARLAAEVARNRNKSRKFKSMSYRCAHCGKWHIGGAHPRLKVGKL